MTLAFTKDAEWDLVKETSTQMDVNSVIRPPTTKDWSTIFMGYEEPLPTKSVGNTVDFDFSDQSVNGWLSLLREELYSNPSVEDIFVSIEDTNVDVWVVIPQRDITVLDQLADIEWKLLGMLVSGKHPPFIMDFHVIYRCDRDVEDLVPAIAIRLPR